MNQPNIAFIMTDEIGHGDVSGNGRRDYSTSNIDRIAERGVNLPRAYVNSAVCSATRSA
jgi:arylsulfatase A-like enzyme